jgi:hypothetical protein
MVQGNDPGCRLAGEPGWAVPDIRDLIVLKPGETIYLPASGDLRCFFQNPAAGIYSFHASYENTCIKDGFEGKIWTGKIVYPVTRFSYSVEPFTSR